jgi:hypothetical protein
MSIRQRCLIISAYLAAHNSKDSDNLTFVGDKSRKRKTVTSSETAGSNAKESFAGSSSSHVVSVTTKAPAIHRYFPLERLLSIYAQVLKLCCAGKDDVRPAFGNIQLHGMIASLEDKHLLIRAPQWRLQRPLYGASISRVLVDSLSTSLKFPLGDFLSVHYKQCI